MICGDTPTYGWMGGLMGGARVKSLKSNKS